MGLVIIANSFTIGVEQTFRIGNTKFRYWDQTDEYIVGICHWLEYFFLFAYTTELAMRCFAHGMACLSSRWVQFDAVLVTFGLVTTFIVEPMMEMSKKSGLVDSNDAARMLGPVMVLRIKDTSE